MARSGGHGRTGTAARGRLVAGDRRWPWAAAAVAAGGLAGAAVAVVLGRRRGAAADRVQEPDEVQAVVDRPPGAARA